jgi:NitT/TauT family transport system ATP-binding protein
VADSERARALEKSASAAKAALKAGVKAAPRAALTAAPDPRVAAAPAAPIIEVTKVKQRYPKPTGGYQVVLNDLSFAAPVHDFISVVGPSGCGKSTLLRLILGAETPWEGAVTANGREIVHPDRSRGIVFQKYSLFPNLTVLENVVFGLELDGTWLLQKWLTWPWYRRTHHRRHVEEAMKYLETVKLAEHAAKYPHQLSGGMQQRVAIAQAMIMKPSILLMDEPFGALDPGTREALQETIVETFHEQAITIFFVTHDIEEAIFVGRRLLVLSPFWSGGDEAEPVGARLVIDVPSPNAQGAVGAGELKDFVAHVRRKGFDPKQRVRVEDFEVRGI